MQTRSLIIIGIILTIIMSSVYVTIWILENSNPAFSLGYPHISQNDLACLTSWQAKYDGNVEILEIILDKEFNITLSNFGREINPDRNIHVKSINQTDVRISIQGIFDVGSNQHDILSSVINDTAGISDIMSLYPICY